MGPEDNSTSRLKNICIPIIIISKYIHIHPIYFASYCRINIFFYYCDCLVRFRYRVQNCTRLFAKNFTISFRRSLFLLILNQLKFIKISPSA